MLKCPFGYLTKIDLVIYNEITIELTNSMELSINREATSFAASGEPSRVE
jgi:hypothetical protein